MGESTPYTAESRNQMKPKTKSQIAIKLRVKHSWGGKDEGGDSDQWIREVELEIVEADQVIGTATLYVFNADGADAAGHSLHDMCDAHSQTTYEGGLAVYQMIGRVNAFRPAIRRLFHLEAFDSLNVLLLAQLEIEPPYRGRGIGLTALSRMIKRWGKGCTLAVMKPYPLQYVEKEAEDTPDFKNACQKLVRYYAPLGFIKIPSQRGNGPYEYGNGYYGLAL
jgi:GNAT superfamily N-acetyltransferase